MGNRCPQCGSDETASVGVARARETTNSTTTGVGLDSQGNVGLVRLKKKQVSEFGAGLYAPSPSQRRLSYNGPVACIMLALIALMFVPHVGRPLLIAVIVFGVAGIAWLFGVAVSNEGNRDENETKAMESTLRHEEQWVCYQCGSKFRPER